jgi:hypothetical protein
MIRIILITKFERPLAEVGRSYFRIFVTTNLKAYEMLRGHEKLHTSTEENFAYKENSAKIQIPLSAT